MKEIKDWVCMRGGDTCGRPRKRRVGSCPARQAANREFYPDVWDVSGGYLEPGETSEQALVRELREVIGVTPTAWASLGEFRESLPGENGSIVLHLYTVTSWNGAPRNLSSEEHSEVSWFAVKDACRLTLAHPSYPEILRRAAGPGAMP